MTEGGAKREVVREGDKRGREGRNLKERKERNEEDKEGGKITKELIRESRRKRQR